MQGPAAGGNNNLSGNSYLSHRQPQHNSAQKQSSNTYTRIQAKKTFKKTHDQRQKNVTHHDQPQQTPPRTRFIEGKNKKKLSSLLFFLLLFLCYRFRFVAAYARANRERFFVFPPSPLCLFCNLIVVLMVMFTHITGSCLRKRTTHNDKMFAPLHYDVYVHAPPPPSRHSPCNYILCPIQRS